MEKRTLQFESLAKLTAFARTLTGGFLINTKNLTLTSQLGDWQIQLAETNHNARLVQTTEKVFSYDAL